MSTPINPITRSANAFIFAVSFKLIFGLFFGPTTEKTSHAHEVGIGLWLPPAVLAGTALAMGLISGHTGKLVNFLSSDAHAHAHAQIHRRVCTVDLAVFQGEIVGE